MCGVSMVYRFVLVVMMLFSTITVKADDLTEFDYPLLLGDWYWFSPSEEGIQSQGKQYRAMHVKFVSDYSYVIRLLRVDGEIDGWQGEYNIDEEVLSLTADGHPTQQHSYQLTYNQFMLDGARFTKLAPENLPGEWVSSAVSGSDVNNKLKLSMNLRPDFLFSFVIQDEDGDVNEHRGIYYIEKDHIVLIYENGQQDSQYVLASDTLILSNEQFGMKAIFERQ